MYRKEIVYDRETRDYAMYLDSELVGFARTYHEADVTLDRLIAELTGVYYGNSTSGADGGEDIDPDQDDDFEAFMYDMNYNYKTANEVLNQIIKTHTKPS